MVSTGGGGQSNDYRQRVSSNEQRLNFEVMIQISYKDRSFIIEEMTEEEKEILKAEKPGLYEKYFEKTEVKIKNKPIKK